MTTKRAKIAIDVEATTEGAVRGLDRVASSTEKSKKAVEDMDKALRKVRDEYKIHQARVANSEENLKKFARAEEVAKRRAEALSKSLDRQSKSYGALGKGIKGSLMWLGMSNKRAEDATQGVMGGLRGIAGAARAAGPVIAGTAVAAGGAALAMKAWGEGTLQTQNVFKNLPFSIEAARKSTKGLADDMTLARNAIMANQSGVATTAEQYAELTRTAQVLALKMGRDVNDTVERITMGIAKQEREILDELVVIPRMEDMWKKAATQMGKTTDELTDQEKNAIFTKEAMAALSKATEGVEIDMDGAAGAIARTTIELQNLKTKALGGGDGMVSMAKGVRSLSKEMLAKIKTFEDDSLASAEVLFALQDLGVETRKYFADTKGLEKEMRKILKVDAKRIVQMAEQNELTVDQLEEADKLLSVEGLISDYGQTMIKRNYERLKVEQMIALSRENAAKTEAERAKQELIDIENQIAFARGAESSQESMNDLLAREAELRAIILEAEGKQAEAAEVRRKAELAALQAEGAVFAPKKGRKRKNERAEEEKRIAEQVRKEQFERVRDLQSAMFMKRIAEEEALDPFSRANAEDQLANVIDLEDRRAQIVLQRRLRAIEEQRAAGVEPIALAQAEAEAQVDALAAREAAMQRDFERQIALAQLQGDLVAQRQAEAEREIAMAEIQDEREAYLHDLKMARLQDEIYAREQAESRKQQLLDLSARALEDSAKAVAINAIAQGASISHGLANVAIGIAKEHGLLALSQGAKSVVAYLSGNVPLGSALAASAAQNIAVAAAAGAIGGGLLAVPNVRSQAPSSRGFGADAFGGGVGAASGPAPRNSGGRADIGGAVPISPDSAQSTAAQAAMRVSAGGAAVSITNHIQMLGDPNEESGMWVSKAQQIALRQAGRLTA